MGANRIRFIGIDPARVTPDQLRILKAYVGPGQGSYDCTATYLGMNKRTVSHSLTRTRRHCGAATNFEAALILNKVRPNWREMAAKGPTPHEQKRKAWVARAAF